MSNQPKEKKQVMKETRKNRRNAGFTLVEMLLVMMIIGTLAAVAVIQVGGMSQKAKIDATRVSISSIENAIQTFEIMTGSYPKAAEELTAPIGSSKGLLKPNALIDSFGTPFQIKFSGDSWEIRSAGPDKQMGNGDDITN